MKRRALLAILAATPIAAFAKDHRPGDVPPSPPAGGNPPPPPRPRKHHRPEPPPPPKHHHERHHRKDRPAPPPEGTERPSGPAGSGPEASLIASRNF